MIAEMSKAKPLLLLFVGLAFTCEAYAEEPRTAKSEHEMFSTIKSLTKDTFCPEAEYSETKALLHEALKSDMSDRQNFDESVSKKDTKRRSQIAGFSAKGCLKDGEDYYIASLIFQHGQLPEHYFQAISFANKSLSLEYPAGALREVAIDRYLMSLGRSQIFASQISAPVLYKLFETELDQKSCLWPIDKTVNLQTDYLYGDFEYRTKVKARIESKLLEIAECEFPSKSSQGLLELLLRIEL